MRTAEARADRGNRDRRQAHGVHCVRNPGVSGRAWHQVLTGLDGQAWHTRVTGHCQDKWP